MKYTKLQREILRRVDFSGYTTQDGRNKPFTPETDSDKINVLVNICFNEVGFMLKQNKNKQEVLAYWLSGLPSCIDIPFYNEDIINFALQVGTIKAYPNDKKREAIIKNYFNFMAYHILKLQEKLK